MDKQFDQNTERKVVSPFITNSGRGPLTPSTRQPACKALLHKVLDEQQATNSDSNRAHFKQCGDYKQPHVEAIALATATL